MIYKFDSFWSYLTNEPDYIMEQAKKLLTKSDYDYKREVWNNTQFWITHSKILDNETIKFPTGLCEFLSRKLELEIDYKPIDKDKHTEQEVLDIANKVKERCPSFEVRDYQTNMALIPCNRYGSFIVSSTSSGKTSTMTLTVLLMNNKKILVMNNQNFILKQIYERFIEMGVDKEEISIGVTDLSKRIVIISSQTSYNKIKEENKEYLDYLKDVEVIINDECFIAGTKVSTLDGYKNIEDIKVGDVVYCFDEKTQKIKYEKVVHTFKQKKNANIKIKINGKTIICTENHPFYTNYGWKTAGEIYHEKTKNYMFLVQKRNHNKANKMAKNSNKQRGACLLFKRMQTCIYFTKIFRNNNQNKYQVQREIYTRQKNEQSNEIGGNEKESIENIKTNWTQTKNSRWQWKRAYRTTKNIIKCFRKWMGFRAINQDKKIWRERTLSDLLQNRYCKSGIKNRHRSRWQQPLFNKSTTTRQEEGEFFNWSRLESIEIQKPRSDKQFVYNFEVNKYNNYFVEGVLVHNCQHFQSLSHFSILFYTQKLQHLIGYTGSPYKNPKDPYKNSDDMMTIGLFGEPAVEFTLQDSIEGNNVAQPYSYFINYQAYPVEYPVNTPFFIQYRRSIIFNKPRNKAGLEMVKYLNKRGIKTLVLFRDIKNHGLKIMKELVQSGVKCLFLQGGEKIHEYNEKMQLESRKGTTDDIKDALNADYNIVLASQVMDEGVDISLFQAGVLFTGGQSPIKIIQQTGRVARKKQGKENIALMIDFNDSQVNKVMDKHYKIRKRTLKNNGVIELPSVHHLFDIIDKMAN